MIHDPELSIGEFADYIHVNNNGDDERLKVKIVGIFDDSGEKYYIIASHTDVIRKIGKVNFENLGDFNFINPDWDTTFVAPDELEKSSRFNILKGDKC